MRDKFGLLKELRSLLGSNQDRANCFTHKKALFIVDQNSVGFIGSPISLDEIDWNFKKTSQNLDKSLGITVASKYPVYIFLLLIVFQIQFGKSILWANQKVLF